MDELTLEQHLDTLLELQALALSKAELEQREEDPGARADEPGRASAATGGAVRMPDADSPLARALDQQLAKMGR